MRRRQWWWWVAAQMVWVAAWVDRLPPTISLSLSPCKLIRATIPLTAQWIGYLCNFRLARGAQFSVSLLSLFLSRTPGLKDAREISGFEIKFAQHPHLFFSFPKIISLRSSIICSQKSCKADFFFFLILAGAKKKKKTHFTHQQKKSKAAKKIEEELF